MSQSEKDRKYDRQLRLWAASGQRALETSHVCLLGATGLGSEIVKNLVLPGIGFLTVIDDSLVTAEDLTSNFFLLPESIGKPIAPAIVELINELNPDVVCTNVQKVSKRDGRHSLIFSKS